MYKDSTYNKFKTLYEEIVRYNNENDITANPYM